MNDSTIAPMIVVAAITKMKIPIANAILARIMEGAKLSWRDRSVQVRPR